MPAEPTVVLDCRWLGIGGPGRTTELVLRGLAESPPPGHWVLWGPEGATSALAWPGTDVVPIENDPRALFGQRRAFDIPRGDFHVFMHQQRPVRSLPSATLIYDTIALRHGGRPAVRMGKRLVLRRIAHSARRILTISEYSRATILRDLGADPDRVEILRLPFDALFADRVLELRTRVARENVALFVGGFRPHKNLPRLLAAFGQTEFRRSGGRLVLVGAGEEQAAALLGRLDDTQRSFVRVLHSCSQADLDRLFATALFLVQPSLEEGFGLPAWEAMCCGMPVCVSDGGALPEVTRGFAEPFPATSVPAMAAAIDACARAAGDVGDGHAARQSAALRAQAPTVQDFGMQFAAIIAGHLPGAT